MFNSGIFLFYALIIYTPAFVACLSSLLLQGQFFEVMKTLFQKAESM